MQRLGIRGLPDLLNAMVLISVFSTGNAGIFTSSRTLYSLALNGGAPKFFIKVNKQGVPIYCVMFSLGLSCLAYLSLSNRAAVVLIWFQNLIGSANLINWTIIAMYVDTLYTVCLP